MKNLIKVISICLFSSLLSCREHNVYNLSNCHIFKKYDIYHMTGVEPLNTQPKEGDFIRVCVKGDTVSLVNNLIDCNPQEQIWIYKGAYWECNQFIQTASRDEKKECTKMRIKSIASIDTLLVEKEILSCNDLTHESSEIRIITNSGNKELVYVTEDVIHNLKNIGNYIMSKNFLIIEKKLTGDSLIEQRTRYRNGLAIKTNKYIYASSKKSNHIHVICLD